MFHSRLFLKIHCFCKEYRFFYLQFWQITCSLHVPTIKRFYVTPWLQSTSVSLKRKFFKCLKIPLYYNCKTEALGLNVSHNLNYCTLFYWLNYSHALTITLSPFWCKEYFCIRIKTYSVCCVELIFRRKEPNKLLFWAYKNTFYYMIIMMHSAWQILIKRCMYSAKTISWKSRSFLAFRTDRHSGCGRHQTMY